MCLTNICSEIQQMRIQSYKLCILNHHNTVKAYKLYKLSDEPTEFMEWNPVAVIPVFGTTDF